MQSQIRKSLTKAKCDATSGHKTFTWGGDVGTLGKKGSAYRFHFGGPLKKCRQPVFTKKSVL